MSVTEQRVRCPYCDEPISVVVDASGGAQQYVEDCQVCCQPMDVRIDTLDDEILSVLVQRAQ